MHEHIAQMKKMLGHVEKWLDTAAEYAQKKSFDPNLFLQFRLAPDQFPLVRQIQSSCDTAKFAAARLTGKEAPKNEDSEKTLDEIRARIRATIAFLDTFTAKDFEGAETRKITNARWEGKVMLGADYFREHSVPNFYFHVTHTYAILRHNGVDVGKRDFLGPLTMRPA